MTSHASYLDGDKSHNFSRRCTLERARPNKFPPNWELEESIVINFVSGKTRELPGRLMARSRDGRLTAYHASAVGMRAGVLEDY